MPVRVCVQSTCVFACQALTKRGRYSLVHCRPCFCCRVLLQSEQVAQLEKDPGTSRCLFPPRPPTSLHLCRPFSRFLPCGRTETAGVGGLRSRGPGGGGSLWRWPLTLSLLKEPVILFLRELRVLLTLVPFSTFSVRSTSSSFLHTFVVLFMLIPRCL